MSLSPFYNSTLKQRLLHSIPKMADVKIKVDKDKADIPRQEEHRVVGERYGMSEHQAVFRNGALLAQRPKDWDSIEELDAEDKADIADEHRHK